MSGHPHGAHYLRSLGIKAGLYSDGRRNEELTRLRYAGILRTSEPRGIVASSNIGALRKISARDRVVLKLEPHTGNLNAGVVAHRRPKVGADHLRYRMPSREGTGVHLHCGTPILLRRS